MTLDADWAERWIRRTADAVVDKRDLLTELDREIGDGDHGENLVRGFRAVVTKLDARHAEAGAGEPPWLVGDVLKLTATTLMSTVGGASGPLYGTAFLRAAKVTGHETIDTRGIIAMLESALDGITARGKAEPGEKTMVDAWTPAVEAAERAAGVGDEADALRAAAAAADAGATATIPLVATKGRASYLGERSAGHEDPGARSTALLLAAAVEALGEETE